MTGRHRTAGPRRGGIRATVVVLAVLASTVGAVVAWRELSQPACEGDVRLTVAAAPEIVPALQGTATAWAEKATGPDGRCVSVVVLGAAPADVAAAVAKAKGTSLSGVGEASGSTPVPDVWVPDSSMWLQRLRGAGDDMVPTEAPSVGRSPVVVAMPEPVAKTLGWPQAKLTWAALLGQVTTNTKLRVGIVEPTRDAAGLAGLLALAAAAAGQGDKGQQATVGAMRALVSGRSTVTDDLLARYPRAADAAGIASGLGAAPISEQAVIAYNAKQPPVKLAALYLSPAPQSLDYPYAVLPGLPPERAAIADGMRGALTGDAFRDQLAGVGLRGPDGAAGGGFAAPEGAPTVATNTPLPEATAIGRALSTWVAISLPARMLAIIDVSGSMAARVPTAGGATRQQVTVEAARRGLGLFDDTWAVGLWTFSTLLDGPRDYRELVPIGPVAAQRTQLLQALGTVRPKPNGATGLYDTIFAGYQAVQRDWDPGRVNSMVVLTDGDNQDANGLELSELIAELKKIIDPKRPVQVIAIGIGTEIGEGPLKQITDVTGGGVFIARDPSAIGDIFLQAIALRSGAVR